MAPTFEDFIQSHQFTFFIGKEGNPIMVHAAAIAATSQQLDALINGGMQESEKRCARIEDIRVDDFIRFCEYAYRGDYTVPPWEELPPRPSSTSGRIQQNDDDDVWGFGTPSKKVKKVKKGRAVPEPPTIEIEYPQESAKSEFKEATEPQSEVRPISRAPLRTQFNSRNYLSDSSPKALILQHFEPKSNSTVYQNFTPVLLAHARLYCFAHVRIITPLKALTLNKLHKTLLNFKLYAERVGDIIELARYAYSNPDLPDRSDDGTLNDLRKLVVDYIVCEIDTIGKYDEFVKYMEEGGEFVGDFWRLAKQYMA
ncbi:hypothetical protein GQ44DRAFT_758484 [Phaeosphaeriaceae sp. PMI808]|nr:hypothetical protein GQ44DRAFT_758484 [Phaeosphaeriaceae sp. PMI808]